MKLARGAVVLFISALLAVLAAQAQIVKSTITGTVQDSSGAVVSGAKVSVTDVGTNVTTSSVTDGTGSYVIPLLNSGTYTAKVELEGFKTAVQSKFALDVATKVRVDFTMQVGQVSELVTVSNVAPLIETDSTTVGLTLTTEKMTQIPILSRNYQALAQLAPTAVTPISNAETANTPGISVGNLYQASGQRGNYNSYTIDGIDAQQVIFQMQSIIPSLDSIQEFKLQTHNFSAEYGRGAIQFTTTTKNGTNQLHGSLYEFVRNNILNANDFFAERANRKKADFHYNQFGGSIGGPVVIPKLYNGTNKTFFFFAYEGTRFRQLASNFATVPDPAWLTGDFSSLTNTDGSPRVIYDPATVTPNGSGGFTRTAFAGNVVPIDRISPVAAAMIPFIPAPNAAPGTLPGTANYVASSGTLSNVNYWAVRIDHHISDHDTVYGRYMQSVENYQAKALLPLSGTVQQNHGRNAMISETHTFGPRVVNEVRFGYNRALNFGLQDGANGTTDYVHDVFHLQNIGGGPLTYGLPSFSWNGYTSSGGNVNDPFAPLTNTYQFTDNLITSFGHHSIKAGVDLRKERYNAFYGTFNRGSFAFSGQYTAGDPTNTASTGVTGNPFADFLLGLSTSVSGLSGEASGAFHQFMQNYYVQDDWRATSKLTLNLGVRYEYYPPWTEENGRATVIHLGFPPGSCFGAGCPPATLVPSQPGKPYYNPDRNNFAPRIGLAYSPFDKTTIRAAYGIFYTPPAVTDEVNSVLNPPTTLNTAFQPSNLFTDLTTTNINNQFPTANITRDTPLSTDNWPLPGISLYTVLPNEPTAIVQQWQLTVERELVRNLLVEVGYVGSHGYDGQRRIDYNQARLDNPGETTSLTSRLPYPALSPLTFVIEHSAQSTYHAGTMRLERRFAGGLSFVSAYTYSKSIDDYGNLNDTTGFWAQNAYDKQAEKGLSAFDARHRFTIGYVFELPFGRGRHFGGNISPIVDKVVGGWQLSGITTFQSGNPLGLVSASDFSNTGNTLVHRPDQVGAIKYHDPTPSNLQWFDPSAFANPAFGTFGDVSRGTIIGPGINNWDMTVGKSFALTERARLQLRAELYNAFNHTQFVGVAASLASPTAFGNVTSTRAPRNIQIAARLEF
jgi:hypothetical protein